MAFVVGRARVRPPLVVGQQHVELAELYEQLVMTELDQPPVVVEDRVRILDLVDRIDLRVVYSRVHHRATGRSRREAGVDAAVPTASAYGRCRGTPGKPGQYGLGRAPPSDDAVRVVQRLDVAEVALGLERVVGHPELLALVDVRRPAVQVQGSCQCLGGCLAEPRRVVTPCGTLRGWSWLFQYSEFQPLPIPVLPADDVLLVLNPRPVEHVEAAVRAVVEVDVLELEHHGQLARGRVRCTRRPSPASRPASRRRRSSPCP